MTEYSDDYPTCARTFATLCVYPRDGDVARVSRLLAALPSQTTRPSVAHPRHQHGWFLSSVEAVTSKDLRRHLDWLVAIVTPHIGALEQLREHGSKTVVSCYWVSANGHGGPILSTPQMRDLANLGLELQLDSYFLDDDERLAIAHGDDHRR